MSPPPSAQQAGASATSPLPGVAIPARRRRTVAKVRAVPTARAANETEWAGNRIAALFRRHQDMMRSFRKEFAALPGEPLAVYQNLRQDLIDASCLQQRIQSSVAFEIFYPSIRAFPRANLIPIDEILEKYTATDALMRNVETGRAANPETCASYFAWGEALDQIFLQETVHVFPEVSPMDLGDLQERLLRRRAELQQEWDGEWCAKWGESLLGKQATKDTAESRTS